VSGSCDCYDYCGEGEAAEFYETRTITARKDHECSFCDFPIRSGTKYVYIRMKFEGEWSIEKHHEACDAMRGQFNRAFGEDGETCVWGDLKSLLRCAQRCADAEPEDVDGDQEGAREFVRLAREHMKAEAGR